MFLGHKPEEDNVTIRNDDKAAEDRGNRGQAVGVGQGQVQEDASNIIVKIAEVVVKLVPPSGTSCKYVLKLELQTYVPGDYAKFYNQANASTRVWLKVPTSAFTFKTLLNAH